MHLSKLENSSTKHSLTNTYAIHNYVYHHEHLSSYVYTCIYLFMTWYFFYWWEVHFYFNPYFSNPVWSDVLCDSWGPGIEHCLSQSLQRELSFFTSALVGEEETWYQELVLGVQKQGRVETIIFKMIFQRQRTHV